MAGPPTWLTGNVPGAGDFDSWFQPSAAVKQADTSIASSTTQVADPELAVPFIANAAYLFTGYLLFTATSGADIQWSFGGFAGGATLRYAPIRANLTGNFVGQFADPGGSTETSQGQGATLANAVLIGTLQTGTLGGTMTLLWAQNSVNATPAILKAQSALYLQRIA